MFKNLIATAKYLDDLAERLVFHLLWPGARARSRCLALVSLLFGFALLSQPTPPDLPSPAADAQSDAYLLDRAWIDNPAAGARDRLSLWYFSGEGNRGGLLSVFQKGAPTKAAYEIFLMQPCNGKLRLKSLYDEHNLALDYRLTRETNGKLDLKLVIKNDPHHGGRDHTYWSRIDKWRNVAGDPGLGARAMLATSSLP